MKRETCRKEKIEGLAVSPVTNKTMVLPFQKETYPEMVEEKGAYKAFFQAPIEAYPELFPENIREGWSLYGFTKESVKQGIPVRRSITKADPEVWPLRPSFVMPYMTCEPEIAEQILFLKKWAPTWALAHAFNKDVMTIHRLTTPMGRSNLVGTTVKQAEKLPEDVAADEKPSRISGENVSIATTVATQCFFGVSVSVGAGEEELTEAYGQFQREARQVQPAYQPETVNSDGWQATMNAWRSLFPSICLIHGLWHAVLRLKNVATRATKVLYDTMAEQAWTVWEAETKRSFAQRLRRLREWGATLTDCPLKAKLLKFCEKKAGFFPAYDFTTWLRTSNLIDRLMRGMDKYLFAQQDFHGTLGSAE